MERISISMNTEIAKAGKEYARKNKFSFSGLLEELLVKKILGDKK